MYNLIVVHCIFSYPFTLHIKKNSSKKKNVKFRQSKIIILLTIDAQRVLVSFLYLVHSRLVF